MSGDFSLRTGVSIGSRTLATCSYTNDRNHYLSALDYGNEDSVNYTCDDKGRVTGQTYEDGDTVAKGTREPSPCPPAKNASDWAYHDSYLRVTIPGTELFWWYAE